MNKIHCYVQLNTQVYELDTLLCQLNTQVYELDTLLCQLNTQVCELDTLYVNSIHKCMN
jgi:hypothetical protein